MEEIKIYQFAEKLELMGYSQRCVADYPYAVGRFFKYLEEKEGLESIQQITQQHITAYHTYLQFGRINNGQHLASRTITTLLGPLKTFYQVMHRNSLVPADLSTHIVPPKRRMQLPRNVPSVENVLTLLQSADGKDLLSVRDRCILELLYATGIRNQELRTLTLDAYNVAEGTLLVHGKGSKDRIVPVGWWTAEYLKEYLQIIRPKLLKEPTQLLFITKSGKMLARNVVGYIVVKYAKKANVNNITPHTLRHACATHLLKNGADIRYVQELLGHTCLSSTQIYTRVDISLLKKAHAAYHPREQLENGICCS